MKALTHVGILSVLLICSKTVPVMAVGAELIDIEPTAFFVPVGFDDNDDAVVVVDGYLPDTCYRLRPAEVTVDLAKKRIVVQPKATRFPGLCLDVTVPYSTVVHLGVVPDGSYTVTTKQEKAVERLDVKKATIQAPDDYLYAPVDSLQVQILSGGKMRASLMGRFTNTCLKIKEVKLINSGKSLEALPIMQQLDKAEGGGACENKEIPFEYKLDLPLLNPGRYLLHVRSLNGQSVNEVFTNMWLSK